MIASVKDGSIHEMLAESFLDEGVIYGISEWHPYRLASSSRLAMAKN
jgi:hypothetical protein